jgi:hypothetical protein
MEQMLEMQFAANITYDNLTYNTKVFVEYKHSGKQYFKSENHYTESKEIAEEWASKGIKVITKEGYWYIDRIAIPIIGLNGKKDKWYINNQGDYYRINKCSKFWNKMHQKLSNNQIS